LGFELNDDVDPKFGPGGGGARLSSVSKDKMVS